MTRPEILARTHVGLEHALLALAAGSAGALAFTTGIPAVLIGVMVAVALLPPTVVAGLLLGSGHFAGATGALALVLTNVACVNLAGVLTFMAQRVRPRTWWEEERARKATAWGRRAPGRHAARARDRYRPVTRVARRARFLSHGTIPPSVQRSSPPDSLLASGPPKPSVPCAAAATAAP